MPLPQQVIDRLSKEPPKTPGWSAGVLTFAAGMLFIAVMTYAGMAFGYSPYLNGKILTLNGQISALAKQVSSDDQGKLITFYSEITNVRAALANHVVFSKFLSWLEQHTEVNVSYTKLGFASTNQITISGSAKDEADVNQQIAIFEAAPEVSSVNVSNVLLSDATGLWQFNATLILNTQAILRNSQ